MILDYSTAYSNYGNILLHFDKIDDAKKSFSLSRNYNPINIKSNFGLSEIARLENNLEEYHKLAIESFKIAYYPEDLAKSFRNLSFYYLSISEKETLSENIEENIKLAICLKQLSEFYDDSSDDTIEEINKLEKQVNSLNIDKETLESINKMRIEESKDILKSKGLPYEAGIEIITICKNLGFQLDEGKKVVPALYYFNIAYDLTGDEDIKLVIDDLNEKIERRRNE